MQGVADDLVRGVVSADVLAYGEQFSSFGKQAGGMEAAGGVEGALGGTEFFWGGEKCGIGDFYPLWDWRGFGEDCVQRCLAAEAAGGTGEKMAGELVKIDGDVVLEK